MSYLQRVNLSRVTVPLSLERSLSAYLLRGHCPIISFIKHLTSWSYARGDLQLYVEPEPWPVFRLPIWRTGQTSLQPTKEGLDTLLPHPRPGGGGQNPFCISKRITTKPNWLTPHKFNYHNFVFVSGKQNWGNVMQHPVACKFRVF